MPQHEVRRYTPPNRAMRKPQCGPPRGLPLARTRTSSAPFVFSVVQLGFCARPFGPMRCVCAAMSGTCDAQTELYRRGDERHEPIGCLRGAFGEDARTRHHYVEHVLAGVQKTAHSEVAHDLVVEISPASQFRVNLFEQVRHRTANRVIRPDLPFRGEFRWVLKEPEQADMPR